MLSRVARALLPLLLLAACGSTDAPASTTSAEAAEEPEEPTDVAAIPEEALEVATPEEAVDDAEVATVGDSLSVRVVLDRATMPANANPSVDLSARLDATLHLRNGGDEAVTVDTVIPAAFELEWTITASDGTVWRPTFLPPPVPPPGGRPRTTVTVPAGGEAEVAALHGISGFRRETAAPGSRMPLPAGTYEVVVSEIRLGDDAPPRTAPPVTLVVR